MLTLTHEQMEWVMRKSENSTKRLIKNYFSQFEGSRLTDWCRKNAIDITQVPREYIAQAEHIKQTKYPGHDDELLTYSNDEDPLRYTHRGSGWIIYLELMSDKIEWDDEMVSCDIKPTMSQMFKGCEIILDLLRLRFPDLISSISIELDDKNLTLKLKDRIFPNAYFDCRIGFMIEKIYM